MRELLQIGLIALVCVIASLAPLAQADNTSAEIVHSVVAGDNLSSIASAYGVTVGDIATANGLDPDAFLQVGQQLRIVFPLAIATDEPDVTAAPTSTPQSVGGVQTQVVPLSVANAHPTAPVAAADVARQPITLPDPELCFALYDDANQNGLLDGEETIVAGGALSVQRSGDGG